jgi:hypothetical protein
VGLGRNRSRRYLENRGDITPIMLPLQHQCARPTRLRITTNWSALYGQLRKVRQPNSCTGLYAARFGGMRGESSFLTGLSIPGTLDGRLTAKRPALRVAFAATPWARK